MWKKEHDGWEAQNSKQETRNSMAQIGGQMNKFSHINEDGNVEMVDVTEKLSSIRIAQAESEIILHKNTIDAIKKN